MDKVTRIPSAPETYLTVRKSRHGFDVVMATPAGRKTLRTVLARAADPVSAEVEARRIAEIQKRPFKRGRA